MRQPSTEFLLKCSDHWCNSRDLCTSLWLNPTEMSEKVLNVDQGVNFRPLKLQVLKVGDLPPVTVPWSLLVRGCCGASLA